MTVIVPRTSTLRLILMAWLALQAGSHPSQQQPSQEVNRRVQRYQEDVAAFDSDAQGADSHDAAPSQEDQASLYSGNMLPPRVPCQLARVSGTKWLTAERRVLPVYM